MTKSKNHKKGASRSIPIDNEDGHEEAPKKGKLLFSLLSLLVTMWLLGFGILLATVTHSYPEHSDKATDAIVVVTGGSNRILTGLELLKLRRSEELFISGVHDSVTMNDIYKLWYMSGKATEIPCCITLGHKAQNTNGNAEEVREWIKSKNFKSLRLVTSNYHIPRTSMEFHHAMPDILIIKHPVKQEKNYHPSDFIKLAFEEYNKIIISYLRHTFGVIN